MNETNSPAPFVSVIVPVYNSAPYLRQCMDSIVGQTLREIEIICVNDGSTDDSPAILEKYAANDPRIRIITQDNLSLGAARNNGFAAARGRYVIFWDSDDWFEPDALERMYRLCADRDADLCICNAQDFDDVTGRELAHNYVRRPYPETEVFNARDCGERIFDISGMNCWNRLVRRQLLIDHDIRYPVGPLIEDSVVTMLELLLAERITLCEKRLIHYRVNRPGSLMSDYSRRADAMIDGCEEAYRQLSERGLLDDETVFRSFVDKVAGLYLYTLPLYGDFDQYKEYYEKLFVSDDSLLRLWDPGWEPMTDAAKTLEARSISPEEYLFRRFQEMTLRDKERRTRIRELEKERDSRILSRLCRAAKRLLARLRPAKKKTASGES